MPKVLYFSSSVHVQGGAVQSMFRNARWLKQRGGQPLVVLPRNGSITDWYEREGIEVLVIPFVEMHRRKSLFYVVRYLLSTIYTILRLTALIRRRDVDIVHVNEITYWPGLMAGKIGGAKTICHVRVITVGPDWVRCVLTKLAYRFSDRILCVSDAVHDKMFGSKNDKVHRLYNPGPDMDRFDLSAKDGTIVRQEFGIEADAFVVGLVSKFSPNKGHLALIECARLIEESRNGSDFIYLLVGGRVPNHEPYYSGVHRMITRYGLQESFVLPGVRNDVPEVIAACDVLVHLPTHEDPLPNVVFEALAMAKPIVAFSSGGIPEQFEDGRSGILLDKNDIQGLANTLLDLSVDEGLRETMGKEGRRFLISHFSFDRFFLELGEIYANLSVR
jgi:glycosyltransferase involved in cell wall biosynthesis